MDAIRVCIFEDNKHLREGLYYIVNGTEGFTCTGAYPDCNNLAFHLKRDNPQVILMDIEMPGMNGLEALKLIRKEFPDIQVIMQTVFDDDENIFNAICNGAAGYILKNTSPAGYMDAVKDVYNGNAPMSGPVARRVLQLFQQNVKPVTTNDYLLTPKEKEILQLLVKGKSFKMIAADAGISYETVRTHIKNIYTKLQVNCNTEAVSKAVMEKIV